jgi:hypothetical protein
MKQAKHVAQALDFSHASELEYFEFEMRKLDSVVTDSGRTLVWSVDCVCQPDNENIHHGVILIDVDQNNSSLTGDKASGYIHLVHEALEIDPIVPGQSCGVEVDDGDEITSVRWVVRPDIQLNS